MTLWFTENERDMIQTSYAITKELFHGVSPFQEVKVVDTKAYGRMMVIDDFIMLTETDEFVYHEMIAHVPVCYHKNPKVAVVIGGGDGGTVRELVKHKGIEKVILCEIDKMVIDAAKEFFPAVACDLTHPKVEVIVGDGVAYMKTLKNAVDIVIVDSTDPFGPGEGLFNKEFYQSVAQSLREGGVMVAQSESPWHPAEFIERIHTNIRSGFKHVKPYVGSIPTYPRGLWSWTMATNDPKVMEGFSSERFDAVAGELKYLTKAHLDNLFEIPPFFRAKLG